MHQNTHISTADNTISVKASLTASVYAEKPGLYISHCMALDLYSQGETPEEAEKNIIEATKAFIRSCLKRRTLNEVLETNGFHSVDAQPPEKKAEQTPASPAVVNLRKIRISVEIPVMVA